MNIKFASCLAVALCLPGTAMADSWKNENGSDGSVKLVQWGGRPRYAPRRYGYPYYGRRFYAPPRRGYGWYGPPVFYDEDDYEDYRDDYRDYVRDQRKARRKWERQLRRRQRKAQREWRREARRWRNLFD